MQKTYYRNEYSDGGLSLICDADIAQRLCTPSGLKKTKNGERDPNKYETWIQCQARALSQAWRLIEIVYYEKRFKAANWNEKEKVTREFLDALEAYLREKESK